MKMVWLKSAESDLDALTDFIAEDNPHIALKIFATIRYSIEKLADFPLSGREGRVKNTRELIIPGLPFIIVYQVKKEVRILAILHTSRKWPRDF